MSISVRSSAIVLFTCLFSSIRSSPILRNTSLPLLLVISFDGFRWDYPDLYHLPNLNSIREQGVRVKYIENTFATATFPLHFTMVTGLNQETHGVLANTMYDRTLNQSVKLAGTKDGRWWSQNPYTQPIWVSNQLANDSTERRSGVIGWPGGDIPINGYLPTRYQSFNSTRSLDSNLKQILDWFREPVRTRINFGAIYHQEPDTIGHSHGTTSAEMKQTLVDCDHSIGNLLQMIEQDDYLKRDLNVILTSDHGMHDVRRDRVMKLDDYTDTSLYSAYGSNAFVNIFVHSKSDIDRVYKNISAIPYCQAFKKSQIPDQYHYKANVRTGDILLIANAGGAIILPGQNSENVSIAVHGYPGDDPSMHAIFYAFGPAFRRNRLADPFRTVDLYPLMSYVLQLNERPTNGSLDNVKDILIDFSDVHFASRRNAPAAMATAPVTGSNLIPIGCVVLIILLAVLYAIFACRHSQQVVVVEPNAIRVHYRLLSNNEESMNNLVISESENEEEIR